MLRDRFLGGRRARTFTLQWHLTNACEGSCRHCYDRSARAALPLAAARAVLSDLLLFCRRRRVDGQVCLTGGNPLLYPDFFDLYRAIADAGLPISILGNPTGREILAQIVALRSPTYYQVSLEGRREHDDLMRGPGHYERTIEFLRMAREMGVRVHVMVTLTRANLGEVLPLAEELRDLAGRVTFNRLSQVGRGADLELPTRDEYVEFLKQYLVASRTNPVLGFKDNLFNIFRHHFGRPLWRGCTGFGCGAAFNFVALLPDGEVHACRKFPSPLGSILGSGLAALYDSALARRYRQGCARCRGCALRKVCGGCLAVVHGQGQDPFEVRDPHCFMDDRERLLRPF
jgi:selenobiotic family peptide radical SAM maturase